MHSYTIPLRKNKAKLRVGTCSEHPCRVGRSGRPRQGDLGIGLATEILCLRDRPAPSLGEQAYVTTRSKVARSDGRWTKRHMRLSSPRLRSITSVFLGKQIIELKRGGGAL